MSYGQIRIIGGEWRGRKLKVPDVPHLRPTPDRVRETLFNWLAPVMVGANCLDAFAGSGALGFEALSRGAAHVTMVDESHEVMKILQEEAQALKAKNLDLYRASVPTHLKKPQKPWDIVFLDPPYQQNVLLPTCELLEKAGFLAENAYIYIEAKQPLRAEDLPANWEILKNKMTGQVAYHLIRRQNSRI